MLAEDRIAVCHLMTISKIMEFSLMPLRAVAFLLLTRIGQDRRGDRIVGPSLDMPQLRWPSTVSWEYTVLVVCDMLSISLRKTNDEEANSYQMQDIICLRIQCDRLARGIVFASSRSSASGPTRYAANCPTSKERPRLSSGRKHWGMLGRIYRSDYGQ
jgi:hypothetical protein